MNCASCNAEIPPQWKACLVSNICPSCSGKIMSDFTQELIQGLTEAITKMPNNPQGIACWLVSNYRMDKINDYEPPQFKEANTGGNMNINASNNDKQKALNDFFARAGVNLNDIAEGSQKGNRAPSPIKEPDDIIENQETIDEVDKMIFGAANNGEMLSDYEKDEIANAVMTAKFGAEKNPAISAMIEATEQRKQNIADGIGAVSKSGKPAGFRRA